MEIKTFPYTFGGDQLRIIFSHEEEKLAFDQAVEKLKKRIEQNGEKREKTIKDFQFDTALQMEVVNDHHNEFKQIVGLSVLNIFAKNSVVIVPLRMQK